MFTIQSQCASHLTSWFSGDLQTEAIDAQDLGSDVASGNQVSRPALTVRSSCLVCIMYVVQESNFNVLIFDLHFDSLQSTHFDFAIKSACFNCNAYVLYVSI